MSEHSSAIPFILLAINVIIGIIQWLLGAAYRNQVSSIQAIQNKLDGFVTKELCAAHRESEEKEKERIERDINNLGRKVEIISDSVRRS